MVDGMTFKESIKNEKEKWKQMNGKQRLSYYKSYYLVPTVIALIVIIFLINIILDMTVRKKEILVNIITVNVVKEEDNTNDLSKDLLEYFGGEGKQTVAINPQYYGESGDVNVDTVIRTMLASEAVDFMLMDTEAYERYSQLGAYADFEIILPKESFSELKDRIIYLDYEDEYKKETYAAAIDITGTDFAKKYYPTEEKLYFVGVANGEHLDRVQDFVSFIFQNK